jgi:hypothetical protein
MKTGHTNMLRLVSVAAKCLVSERSRVQISARRPTILRGFVIFFSPFHEIQGWDLQSGNGLFLSYAYQFVNHHEIRRYRPTV